MLSPSLSLHIYFYGTTELMSLFSRFQCIHVVWVKFLVVEQFSIRCLGDGSPEAQPTELDVMRFHQRHIPKIQTRWVVLPEALK